MEMFYNWLSETSAYQADKIMYVSMFFFLAVKRARGLHEQRGWV